MAVATTRFADVVRTKLAENKTAGRTPDSVRSLAKTMGKGSEAREKTHRRSLFKWMSVEGPRPSSDSRALVAEALGNCEASELGEDDEESHRVSSLTLDEFLRLRIEHHVDSALANRLPSPERV